MKKYAVIPIFIPHQGCPHDCIFCNQKKITAHELLPTADEIRETLDIWLSTLEDVPTVELAFYGGSFTAIPIEEQNLYLEAAKPFLSTDLCPPAEPNPYGTAQKDCLQSSPLCPPAAQHLGGTTKKDCSQSSPICSPADSHLDDMQPPRSQSARKISAIRLSTRPDYITPEILENLKAHGVKTIELGVQSLDPEVLRLSGRGHDTACIYESARMIKDYGFRLGIQLMIGLPGDTLEKCIYSARETVKLAPSIARLYPTVVMPDTVLYDQYLRGEYTPLTEEEAILRTKEMYRILTAADIQIIRVGLKSSHVIVGDGGAVPGTYYPAFRQLVEGSLARDALQAQLAALGFHPIDAAAADAPAADSAGRPSGSLVTFPAAGTPAAAPKVDLYSNPRSFPTWVGPATGTASSSRPIIPI